MMFGGKQVVVCGYGEVGIVTTVYTSNTALSISLSLVSQTVNQIVNQQCFPWPK